MVLAPPPPTVAVMLLMDSSRNAEPLPRNMEHPHPKQATVSIALLKPFPSLASTATLPPLAPTPTPPVCSLDVLFIDHLVCSPVYHSSRNSERRRIQVVLPYGATATGGIAGGNRGGGGGGGMDCLDSPVTTALEAQHNDTRRIKQGRDLRRERQAFLSQLTQERNDRFSLEAWAASSIQALFRGFLARPRPPRPRPRQALTPAESNRRLVADLQAILARAGLPTIPGLGPDGRKALEGSDWGRGRGVATRAAGGPAGRVGGGLRRSRSRKQRLFEDDMGTRITKVVRGFLDRKRAGRYRRAWDEERRWAGASRIQHAWRSHRKRMGWHELESGIMGRAAAKIQARWRGMACRMALSRRSKENALWRRKTVSAITIQATVRRRLAVARIRPKLTLWAARKEREARAATEAARPRRRRNRGGPATGAGRASLTEDGESGGGTLTTQGRGKGTVAGAGVGAKATPARGGSPARSADTTNSARSVAAEKGVVGEGSAAGALRTQTQPRALKMQAGAKTAASGSNRDTAQGEVRDWERGSQEAEDVCEVVNDDGIASVSTATTANGSASTHLSKHSTNEEKIVKGGDGVRFAAEVEDCPAEIKRRASQAVSLHFVQDSILAAVVNTRTAPRLGSASALDVSDNLTDIESSAVTAVAPQAGPRHDLLHALPPFVE